MMTQDEAKQILMFVLDIVRREIDACDGGDRPISPPVWKLRLEIDLFEARSQLRQPKTLPDNLWVLESLRDLIHEPAETHTARNVRTVFQAWQPGVAQ